MTPTQKSRAGGGEREGKRIVPMTILTLGSNAFEAPPRAFTNGR